MLALPQIAAVAQLARKLGIPVSRPAVAASADHDIDLWVTAHARRRGCRLVARRLDRAAAGGTAPCLAARRHRAKRKRPRRAMNGPPTRSCGSFACRRELAEHLGVDVAEASGPAADPDPSLRRRRSRRDATDQRCRSAAKLHRPESAQPRRRRSRRRPRAASRDRRGRAVSRASGHRPAATKGRPTEPKSAARPSTLPSTRRFARRSTASSKARKRSSNAPTGRCAATMPAMATTSPPPPATCSRWFAR